MNTQPPKTTMDRSSMERILLEHQRFLSTGGLHGDIAYLADLLLEDVDLSGLEFMELDLVGCVFRGCNLDGATFSGARLGTTEATGCSLRGARMIKVTWVEGSLAGSNITDADLTRAVFVDVDCSGVRWEGVRLVGTVFQRCTFDGSVPPVAPSA